MGSFVKVCKKVNDGMLSAETVILGIITAFLVACIFIEVVCRYFFFISVPWAEELTRYLFIWSAFLSVSLCTRKCISIKVDQFIKMFPKRGKTIFMSSHIFEEIERTCDRTAMIKDGRLISIEELQTLKASKHKTYQITFATQELVEQFMDEGFECKQVESNVIKVVPRNNLNYLLATLSRYDIIDLDITKPTLEELFLHFYGGDES